MEARDFFDVRVHLSLMQPSDFEGLLQAGQDPDVWKWFTEDLSQGKTLKAWMDKMLQEYEQGVRVPFTIRDVLSQQIIGSTSYMNIAPSFACLEIGTTWLSKHHHGNGINYNMKFLLLNHAFENANFYRVEFRTDVLNVRSRKAIEKLGAVEEGIFRSHRFNKEGGRRDSIIYSIIKQEWPDVKVRLLDKIKSFT